MNLRSFIKNNKYRMDENGSACQAVRAFEEFYSVDWLWPVTHFEAFFAHSCDIWTSMKKIFFWFDILGKVVVGWCPFIISLMTNSNHFYSKQFSFSKINIKCDIRYVIYTRPSLVLPVERYHL